MCGDKKRERGGEVWRERERERERERGRERETHTHRNTHFCSLCGAGHTKAIRDMAMCAEQNVLVTCSFDKTVRFWGPE